MVTTVFRLPPYPSTQSRKTLSSSQRSSLYKTISSALQVAVSLPPEKQDTLSLRKYIATYVKDVAFHTLQNLIWKDVSKKIDSPSSDEKLIQSHSLRLAEKLALSSPGLDIQTLLDLSIIYSRIYPSQLHTVFQASLTSDSELPKAIANDLIPCFTLLLTQQSPHSQGLYAQRKAAECVYTFLRACKGSPELIRPFVHDKEFILALASLYDVGMIATCASYGGIPALMSGIAARDREADDWERIWVETKVALIDSFHIILSTLLDDLALIPTGTTLAAEAERFFDIVFTLLDVSTSSSSSTDTAPIPFLNQSLLADYQQAYTLSKSLASSLRHAEEKDVRLDLLESMLESLDTSSGGRDSRQRDAGALKILLRSSGSQPGIDNLNHQSRPNNTDMATNSSFMSTNKNKGKARAVPLPPTLLDTDLDMKATQVLDILPDISINHVKLLLIHGEYGGNPEKVIEALLEGTAMSEEDLEQHLGASQMMTVAGLSAIEREKEYDVSQRKNVFDGEALDVSKLRFGKKNVSQEITRDRSSIEQMKADILRRAEIMLDEEVEEEDSTISNIPGPTKGKEKYESFDGGAFGPEDEDEFDPGVRLRVGGDGEGSDESDENGGEGDDEQAQSPETIVELAYLRDPKVFERDATTRRSKARADLKAQTGWADEQIEGWKVMLDRTPDRKDKLKEKHEFAGNEKGLEIHPGIGGGSRGRARGAFRGGRGRGRGNGDGDGNIARERAWKDKNKGTRANHNRKRGHDKKMARAGPAPSM